MRKYSEKLSTIFQRVLFAVLILSVFSSFSVADETKPTLIEQNQTEGEREYKFDKNEIVTPEENLGTTASGYFTVTGINNSTNGINFNSHTGFIVSQSQTTLNISNLTLENALSDSASVIYNTADDSSLTLTNLIIKNNSNVSETDALGGAIYTTSPITITNTSFIGNYAKSANGTAKGGAIYANNNVNLIADGQHIEISGNYANSPSDSNAVYMSGTDSTLNITANNNGRIDLNDNIDGENNYNVTLKGDKTGTIGIYGSIENGNVSTSNVNITFADNKTTNHRIDHLTIGENTNFVIDVDLANAQADNLASNGGSGTMNISSLNILSAPSGDSTTVQVLNSAGNIKLDISQLAAKRVSSVSSLMYNDTIFADSISLNSGKDSIILTGVKDVLYETIKDTLRSDKSFYFRTDSEYNLTENLTELGFNQHILINAKKNGDEILPNNDIHGVINANGHSMFKITNNVSDISLYNTTIKNAETTTNGSVVNITNTNSSFSMQNSSELTNNHSDNNGGAIYATRGQLSIKDSSLTNNTAGSNGGAIYYSGDNATIVNTDFKNNSAGAKGGAIYATKSLTISADKGTSTFESNSANGENNAIYVSSSNATLTLDARNNGTLNMNDKISGTTGKYNVDITGNSTGNVNINNSMENAKVSLISGQLSLGKEDVLGNNEFSAKGGTLNLENNKIDNVTFGKLNINGTTNIKVDVDLANAKMDNIKANSYGTSPSGKLNVNKMNLLSDTTNKSTRIQFMDPNAPDNIRNKVATTYSKVYKYVVSYDSSDGCFLFSRGGGHDSGDFNPTVLAGAVGQQMAYANQLANYEYATYHSNTYMMLPKRNRLGMENKYAHNEPDEFDNAAPVYQSVQEEVKSIWVRPYTSFESIPLKNGPKVSSINYGILAGGDSNVIDIGHGFKYVYGGYIGYNGNSYHYSGINAVQQGGLIGGTVNIYKGNFFNTLTANIGWQINDSDTPYGSNITNMLITGFADKFGYNIEISGGKIIIQPSINMGYTYVGAWDYTAANGAKIETDPLHIMHFIPGLKIIGNTKNGWQPYAVVNVVCNFGGTSHYTANNIVLPSMSINPYVEYGFGIQKRWADKYSGFAQATVRSGGRRGAALLFGFRYMLGQIAEKTANLLHADPVRKMAMFKEKKDPHIVIEPIRKWRGAKKIAKENKDSKLRNIWRKATRKLCFWYKTDVSAKMVDEVYPDGVIRQEAINKKSKKTEEYKSSDTSENVIIIEKPVRLKKEFIEHKVAEKTMLDYNKRIQNQPDIGGLKNLIEPEQEPAPSQLITEAPLFKTDAILKRHKPANKSLYINQNNYKDYSSPKSFNDFCVELIHFKF